MKNIASQNGVVQITQIAEELNVNVEDLLPSFEVLLDLNLVEIDEANGLIQLTNNGRYTNLEYLC